MKKLLFSLMVALSVATSAQNWFDFIPQDGCISPSPVMYMPTVVVTTPVSGATSYSWTVNMAGCTTTVFQGNNGFVASYQSPCTGQGTVTVYAINGTSTITTQSQTIDIKPAASFTAAFYPNNGAGCLGTTFTLYAGGTAMSYTTFGPGAQGVTGIPVIVTPTASGAYTIIGTAASGCTASTILAINLSSGPVINVPSAVVACEKADVFASGAQSYTWSNGTYGAYQQFTTTGCYTVTGSASACPATASAVVCVTVKPSATITVAGPQTVCLGSSFNFTASGANTYTWYAGPSASPPAGAVTSYTAPYSHSVMVGGWVSGNPNLCAGYNYFNVYVDTLCTIVWPGDANNDGTVDAIDILEIGLYTSSSGAARSNASTNWTGQYASVWPAKNSTGWTRAHVDCDGDGTVGTTDANAVNLNFSQTHGYRAGSSSGTGGEITLAPQNQYAFPGIWNKIDIMAGDGGALSNVYGMAFDITFDPSKIEADQIKIEYTPSFLNTSTPNIEFSKVSFANGRLHAATVRTDQANVSGSGKIGEVWFKIKGGIADNTQLNFSVTEGVKINNGGTLASSSGGGTEVSVNNDVSGLSESGLGARLNVYPNPAGTTLVLNAPVDNVSYTIRDISGRIVVSGAFSHAATIDVSGLEAGVYLIESQHHGEKASQKLIIER